MNTIYKYQLRVADIQSIRIPKGANILTVQTQNGTPCLWALVDTDQPFEQRSFYIVGTGNQFWLDKNKVKFISTFQLTLPGGIFVGHVFEEIVG